MKKFPKSRLSPLAYTTLPVVFSCLLSIAVIQIVFRQALEQQLGDYGDATSRQLAITLTEHLINNDLLSLNVLLSEFVNQQYFDQASVYSAEHKLLAQAGTGSRYENVVSYLYFSSEISFQQEVIGLVEVAIDTNEITHKVTIASAYVLFGHLLIVLATIIFQLKRDRFTSTQTEQNPDLEITEETTEPAQIQENTTGVFSSENTGEPEDASLLLMVIKSASNYRHEAFLELVNDSLVFYNGTLISGQPGDYCISMEGINRLRQMLCYASLLQSLYESRFSNRSPSLSFRAGIHVANDGHFHKARKHTSYISSIARYGILVSKEVREALKHEQKITFSPWRDSAVSDDQVFRLDSLGPEFSTLIAQQKQQLTRQ